MSASGSSATRSTPGWSRLFVPVHMWLYRTTGGRIGHRLGAQHTLLLTTTGRKSGQPRTLPITYFRWEGDIVLVASNWGSDRHPAWYHNLITNPRAHVQLKGDSFDVEARTVSSEERARIWPSVVAQNAQYVRYQAGNPREIPVVLLRRLQPGA